MDGESVFYPKIEQGAANRFLPVGSEHKSGNREQRVEMRSSVAVTLIVCGTIFALVPTASDYFHGYQLSQFLTDRTIQTGITRIHQPFSETYRAAAWVLGATMIGLGVLTGGWSARTGHKRTGFGKPRHDMLAQGKWRPFEGVQTVKS